MKPINFTQANIAYIGDEFEDLPAHKAPDQIISCWKLDEADLKRINETGVVWFSVIGNSQPPIWLGTESPFIEKGMGTLNVSGKHDSNTEKDCEDESDELYK